MKRSQILHLLAQLAGLGGILALVGAWLATAQAGFWGGLSTEHLFNDAQALLLLSIALALGVLIHRQQEKGL